MTSPTLVLDADALMGYVYILLIIALVGAILAFFKILFSSECSYDKYKERIRELEKRVSDTREYYEQLLRETTIRNDMMRGLWEAWSSGELKRCILDGGSARVLSDGVVVCDMGREDKSYAIVGGGGDG